MGQEQKVIEIENLHKNFKDNEVLKNVSLTCEKGKIYGIVGHNGSGKTVLLKCICGFLNYNKGNIYINGKKMGEEMDMLDNAGIIIEEPGFLRKWNGYQNLDFLYTIRNRKNKNHLYAIMNKVGLNPKLNRPVGKYSLGMKQRLAIAQAIMEDPEILILDEPMNGLDPIGIAEMRGFLVKLSREQGKTILISSHILSEIELVADRVGIMDHGVLLAQKNMKELKKGEETLETYFRNVTGGVGIA